MVGTGTSPNFGIFRMARRSKRDWRHMSKQGHTSNQSRPVDIRELLIGAVYDAVIDHARFEEILGLVLALVEATVEDRGGVSDAIDETLVTHFERAEYILGSIDRPAAAPTESTRDNLTATTPDPMISAGRDGRILSASTRAQAALGLGQGDSIWDLAMHADSAARLEALMGDGAIDDRLVLRVARVDDTRPMTLAARLVPVEGGRSRGLALHELSLQFSSATVDLVMRSFGLTPAETKVLSHLAEGLTPSEIAIARARSIETIRAQIRSLVAKTDASHVTDLVGLALGAAQVAPRPLDASGGPDGPRRLIRLPDGRAIDLAEQGDPDGRPVLFVHGCLGGRRLPPTADLALKERGIRMICPARPLHGTSDRSPAGAGHSIAHDWCALFDILGIDECGVIAYDVGVGVVLRALPEMRGRISNLLGVSMVPPLTEWSALTGMPVQQRVFPTLARISPGLVGYLARIGDRRLRTAGMEGFAEVVFKDAPTDLDVTNDPELRRLLWEGHLFHVEHGSESFIGDIHQSIQPVPEFELPIHLIHGEQDESVAPKTIQRFADPRRIQIDYIKGAGHILPFSHWSALLRYLTVS